MMVLGLIEMRKHMLEGGRWDLVGAGHDELELVALVGARGAVTRSHAAMAVAVKPAMT